MFEGDLCAQDIPAAADSAGQAAAAVDGVFHVLSAGEEAEQEEQDQQGGKALVSVAATANESISTNVCTSHRSVTCRSCYSCMGSLSHNCLLTNIYANHYCSLGQQPQRQR